MTAEELSQKARIVLQMIARGHTYEQILAAHPELTYPDIFAAAQEALNALGEISRTTYEERLARIRQKYPRAYESWTEEEETRLKQLIQAGRRVNEIARELGRQPGAIHARAAQLGLLDALQPREQKGATGQ